MDFSKKLAFDFSKFIVNRNNIIYWDEWNFYASGSNFLEAAEQIAQQISDDENKESYVLCALSKSGLPLASVISIILRKPLIIYTIGEFFTYEGLPIIDIVEGEEFKSCIWHLIDSHIHSGQTALLAASSIDSKFSAPIGKCYVISDCRKEDAKEEFQLKVGALIDSTETWEQLTTIITKDYDKPEQDLEKDEFWTYHDKSWLTSLPREMCEPEKNVIKIKSIKIGEEIKKIILKEDMIYPSNILLNPDEFASYVEKIAELWNDVDTVIACSVGGIPLASAVCYALYKRKILARFVFLGNNNIDYFQDIFKQSKKAIIVDDVVSAGSLMATTYNIFIVPNKIELLGIICLAKTNFPEQGRYFIEDENGIPLFAAII